MNRNKLGNKEGPKELAVEKSGVVELKLCVNLPEIYGFYGFLDVSSLSDF